MPPALKAPLPKPRAGQFRRPRIEGLGSPAPASLRALTPTYVRASTPLAHPQARPKALCPNPDCPDRSKVTRTDQGLICESCGALVQEDSGLVSEQGFGETDSGRIVATGVNVGQDQTHQKNYQTGGAFAVAGREAPTSSERTRTLARSIMTSYIPIFGLQPSVIESGMFIFALAYTNNFLKGRTIETVAVTSLYVACRRKKEQVQGVQRPVYGLMLIDFAERLNMDVFALGKIYRDLYERIWLDKETHTWRDETASADLVGMDPAVLVPKFVKELEFDKRDEPKIQYDAIQIIKRMKRDWIHHGRRPSGVCGAAVLLAARMNNYRRTTREIVLTAKVTEITLNKRLQEFHNTQVSSLSVTKFSEEAKVWEKLKEGEHWLDEDQPPINKERMKPKEKKKRGRPRKRPLPETAAEIEGGATPDPQPSDEAQPPPAKRVRIDAEGYKIPDIPSRRTAGETSQGSDDTLPTPVAEEDGSASGPSQPDENGEGGQPEQTGKRYRAPNWQPPPISEREIALEENIQGAFDETLDENRELSESLGVHPSTKSPALPTSSTTTETATDPQSSQPQEDAQQEPGEYNHDPTQTVPPHRKDKILGPPCNTSIGNLGHVSLDPTIGDQEFDDDEDIATCKLSEEEARIKERVWVSMNADWLRKTHAKRIKKELMEADMRARGLDPVEEEKKKKAAKGKRKDGTKRPGRRGDVSYLKEQNKKKKAAPGEGDGEVDGEGEGEEGDAATDAEDASVAGTPRTAAKAVRSMLEARGTFSRRINYAALDAIYGTSGTSEESAESRSATGDGRSRSGSVAVSEADQQASREGSAAGPSSSARRKPSTPLTPLAIFRGNIGRDRRGTAAAERRERKRQADQAAKKTTEEGDRSASRSRSTSTPVSEASAHPTPEPRSRGQVQTQTQPANHPQPPLPTPPATQLGPQVPGILATTPASTSSHLSTQPGPQIPSILPSTPPTTQLGPQVPGIRSTALPTTPSSSTVSRRPQPRQPSKSKSRTPDDDDDEDEEEDDDGSADEDEDEEQDEDEDEDEERDKQVGEDLDALFEGRYQRRGSGNGEDDE